MGLSNKEKTIEEIEENWDMGDEIGPDGKMLDISEEQAMMLNLHAEIETLKSDVTYLMGEIEKLKGSN